MIKYVNINIERIKSIAFNPETNGGKAILCQDLLIRMKNLKEEEGLSEGNFVFLQNSLTGEIKMKIV